jgi:hypothetical protein
MRKIFYKQVLLSFLLLCPGALLADKEDELIQEQYRKEVPVFSEEEFHEQERKEIIIREPEEEEPSVAHQVLLYVPNRFLDLLDIFRIRARVGPGVQFGIRASEFFTVELGFYDTMYFGLPGPRLEPRIRSPLGFETYNGKYFPALEKLEDPTRNAQYSSTEIGLDAQAGILGLALSVDPVELYDFFAGFLFMEVRDDDL